MDAVAAVALALTVVEPQSSGIGGGGLLVYQAAGGTTPTTFDGREKAPQSATDRLFLLPDGSPQPRGQAIPGGRSVGVPGNVAMLRLAHAKYGRLPWATLFGPAIALARGGYDVTPRLARTIDGSKVTLARQPAAAALFLHADGTPKTVGEHIVNEALARTFEAIAADGPDAFLCRRQRRRDRRRRDQCADQPCGDDRRRPRRLSGERSARRCVARIAATASARWGRRRPAALPSSRCLASCRAST